MSDKTNSVLAIAASAITAYRFVKLDTGDATKVAQATATDLALGVALAASAADGSEALVAIDGYALVDFAEEVQPYTEVEVGTDGKAAGAATVGAFIPGYYCPEPVDGAVSAVAAGARGRIVLYNYKGRTS